MPKPYLQSYITSVSVTIKTRCLIFTPASRPERFDKARECGADGVILDLEDAVAAAAKASAREAVTDYLRKKQTAASSFAVVLRINPLATVEGLRDCLALAAGGIRPDLVMLPKAESPRDLEILGRLLGDTCGWIPLLETARGLRAATEIAAAPGVCALAFGGIDYAADIGADMDWEPLYAARAQIVQAAATAGVPALDVPCIQLGKTGAERLAMECKRAKAMGFAGKLAVHPCQVAAINEAFRSTESQLKRAREVIAAFEQNGGNALEFNGQMIDKPVYQSALRVIANA